MILTVKNRVPHPLTNRFFEPGETVDTAECGHEEGIYWERRRLDGDVESAPLPELVGDESKKGKK